MPRSLIKIKVKGCRNPSLRQPCHRALELRCEDRVVPTEQTKEKRGGTRVGRENKNETTSNSYHFS